MRFTLRGLLGNALMRFFAVFPIQNKIVFSSFDGQIYGDNPQVLFEEIRSAHPNISIEGAVVVKAYSVKAIYHQATAKVWVFNSRQRNWIVKRKCQYYVQTWHGDVCIKKIEADAKEQLGKSYMEEAEHDSQIADLMISGSDFRTNNYRTAFMYDGDILEFGTPKSEIYYNDPYVFQTKVKDYYNLEKSTKIALYCPTFRKNGDLSVYNLDYCRLVATLRERWGGDWVLIVRLHPKMQERQDLINYSRIVLNGSKYSSTAELIQASDIIITDYSGCMFQGMEANKKVVLYAPDLNDYVRRERNLYFDIHELPFPLAESNQEIEQIVMEFDENKYYAATENLKKQLGYKTEVGTTKKVVEYILDKNGGMR